MDVRWKLSSACRNGFAWNAFARIYACPIGAADGILTVRGSSYWSDRRRRDAPAGPETHTNSQPVAIGPTVVAEAPRSWRVDHPFHAHEFINARAAGPVILRQAQGGRNRPGHHH